MNDTNTLAPQGTGNTAYSASAPFGTAGSLDPTLAPPVSQTQNASDLNSQISGNTQGVVFPQAPGAPTNAISANTSVTSPIPTAADVLSQGTAQTPAEKTNTTLLQKVAALIGGKTGQQTMTNQAEQSAGVPGLQSTYDQLNSQIQGLNDQATQLSQAASPGGAIQNQEQQNAQGRGITTGGLAPTTAADLRENQIKQAAIASQSLTLKAALYGAQNKLSMAKDAADKAALAQYEDQQNQIDYMNALIAANAPQMNKEEKAQAALVTQNLQDRQTQITNAQEDKKTIIAMAVAAMKNNPNDPAAQYAAQQALAESNQQQPDLQKALSLVGAFQSDPNATAKAIADLANTRADIAYKNAQTRALDPGTPGTPGADIQIDPNSQSILTQTGLSLPAFAYLTQGTAALTRMSAAQRLQYMNEAQNWANKSGTDISTFQAQYGALSKTVGANLLRNNQAKVAETELAATVTNLSNAASEAGLSNLNGLNVAKIWAGQQLNSPQQATYKFHLEQLRNEFAMYNASLSGQLDANGNVRQTTEADMKAADGIIQNGFAAGSLDGFSKALNASMGKMDTVLKSSVDAQNKQVWNLFGVGDKFQSTVPSATNTDFAKSTPNYNVDLAAAKAAIAGGAPLAQVKARMLTKYKQVDL
jgi:hypothetical protein